MTSITRDRLHAAAAAALVSLGAAGTVEARMVWADDFTGEATGHGTNPSNNFPGGLAWEDWTVFSGFGEVGDDPASTQRARAAVWSAGPTAPALVLSDDFTSGANSGVTASVNARHFAPFDTTVPGQESLRFRADFAVTSLSTSLEFSAPRFLVNPTGIASEAFGFGFARRQLDADPALELYLSFNRDNVDGFQGDNVIGLDGPRDSVPSAQFEPGFDFGEYNPGTSAEDLAANDTTPINASTPVTGASFAGLTSCIRPRPARSRERSRASTGRRASRRQTPSALRGR